MSTEKERMQILEMIERGEITPSQGLELLNALEGEPSPSEGVAEAGPAGVFPSPAVEPEESSIPDSAPVLPAETQDETAAVPPAPVQHEPVNELPIGQAASTAWETQSPPDWEATPPVGEAAEEAVQGEVIPPATRLEPDFDRWRSFWLIPLWVGVGITILSGVFMFLAWQSRGLGFLFACTWFPFILGVAVMALAWSTRNLPWLHIRIQQKPGERPERIAISLPLPLSLIGWVLNTFKHRIPNTGNVNLEDMVMALKQVSPDAPFSVNVDEGEDGERVQIYIG